jgi:hypothetical protein
LAFVARVLPRGFGAYGPTVDLPFLWFSTSGPTNVLYPRRDKWQLVARVSFVISLKRTPYGTN